MAGAAGATAGDPGATAPVCEPASSCGDEIEPSGDAKTRYFFCDDELVATAPCPSKCSLGVCVTQNGSTVGSASNGAGCKELQIDCRADQQCALRLACRESCLDGTEECEAMCAETLGNSAAYKAYVFCMEPIEQ
jgi:hypothetical protein